MIKVDTVCMEAQAQEMQQIANELNNIISRVDAVNRNLRWNTNVSSQIRTRLSNHSRGIANLDEKAVRLAKALNVIVADYVQTENKVRNYEKLSDEFRSDYSILDWIKEHNLLVPLGPDGKLDIDRDKFFKDIVIDKSVILPAILTIVSPAMGLGYITSGLYKGEIPLAYDPDRHSSADWDWIGAGKTEDGFGVNAWIGKGKAEAANEWGYAGVEAAIGKVEAKIDGEVDFWKKTTKKEYVDGKWKDKTSVEIMNAEVEAGVEVEGISGNVAAGVGTDMLGLEGKLDGSVGNAKLGGKGKFSIGEKGINANLSGEALVSAVEGEASGSINILGIEIKGSVGGYAGAIGVEGKVGFEDGKFVCRGGAAAAVGVSGGIEIGFNDEGWDNFIDAVIFWD